MKKFAAAAIAFVIAVTLLGFYIAGSPFTQRKRRFDTQRIQDLSQLQSKILCYRNGHKRLPNGLSALASDTTGFEVPRDPETGVQYEYHVTNDTEFDLCATFTLSTTKGDYERPWGIYGASAGAWRHPAGRTCFHRNAANVTMRYATCGPGSEPNPPIMPPSGGS